MTKPKQLRFFAAGCLMLAIATAPSVAAACPMCKAALASNGGDLVSGFFYSILFMLSMPFLILGGLSSYLYLLVRRARAEQQLASGGAAVASHAHASEPVGV
jgi:hypothetical protein